MLYKCSARHASFHRSPPRHAPSAALSPLPLPLSRLAVNAQPPRHHAAAPPGEIRSDMRLSLSTFDTAHEAAHAYDAAAWRLRRSRRDMNFPNVPTREIAPPLRLITNEDCRENRRRERRLSLAKMGEEAMELWRERFPQDVINERQFFTQRRVEREETRAERAAYREDRRMRKAAAEFNIELGDASS
ncbi:uncharacterized protein [Aegilops tauschii subsp. strangulata]|uniref:uncharacterized protein n=1 Tax=Aegilops tauschii subsp. strangulata TaxID=200361 RepID=UPI00098A9F85|nr:ethylene-responsive transcription factor ERF105-like [Aegilops tauschii subsp. strangulata]